MELEITMSDGDLFFEQVKGAVRKHGFIIDDALDPFDGAIKPHKRPKHFAYFTKSGKRVLVKTYHQRVSGSTTEKIVAQYINLSGAPFDVIIMVCNTLYLNAFTPYLDFFKCHKWTLNNIYVMSLDEFEATL